MTPANDNKRLLVEPPVSPRLKDNLRSIAAQFAKEGATMALKMMTEGFKKPEA